MRWISPSGCALLLLAPFFASRPAFAQDEKVLEGFLVRRADGSILVTEEIYPRPDRVVEPALVLDAASARRFESVELHEPADSPWSQEAMVGHGPRYRLRLRATIAREAPTAGARGGAGVDRVTVREVLGVEFLSRDWLDRRAETRRRLGTLTKALDEEAPAKDKRPHCLALARAVVAAADAMAQAQAATQTPPPLADLPATGHWRARQERALRSDLRGTCLAFDLDPAEKAPVPTRAELRDLFVAAPDGDGLRAALAPFGAAVLEDTVLWEENGYATATAADLLGWDRDRFAATQARVRDWLRRKAEEVDPRLQEMPEYQPAVERAGLRVDGRVPRAVRAQALVTGGVAVTRVEAQSRAERAGLRAGDLIWRVQGDYYGKGARRFVFVEEVNLSRILSMAEKDGTAALTLDVIRDGECREVALPMK